nr:hypothetical protein [uncultured Desulfobulbus sp.]
MNKAEIKRFESLYERHLQKLALQGKSAKTIDAYGRAVRRLVSYFDRCPDKRYVCSGVNTSTRSCCYPITVDQWKQSARQQTT